MNELFAIRPYNHETDFAFCSNAWLLSQRYSPRVRHMASVTYFAEWKPIVTRSLLSHATNVAHVAGEPEALLGFLCESTEAVLYCYVKRDARRLGVATALLPEGATAEGALLLASWPVVRGLKLPSNWTYNPELLHR